jgi:GNAT superfamily N-acetyltransferase
MTRVYRDENVTVFQQRAGAWLAADPVLHAVPASLVGQRVAGTVPVEPDAWWLRVCADDGAVLGVALRTPPHELLLAAMPAEAVAAVVDWCVAQEVPLGGVVGPCVSGEPFAARYSAATGARAELWMAQRIYRLDAVTPPTGVPGAARPAVPAEIPLLSDWVSAFAAETGTAVPDARLAERVAAGRLWVWTDTDDRSGPAGSAAVDGDPGPAGSAAVDGDPGPAGSAAVDGDPGPAGSAAGGPGVRPVAMNWTSPPAAGVVRVSAVYTPPERRGRGYASALVAATSQAALADGATACTLFTDLANPTSNAIYQRIGYRPVADAGRWRFRT